MTFDIWLLPSKIYYMHAFLFVGQNPEGTDEAIQTYIKKLGVAVMEFPLQKIEQVRSLDSFANLKLTKPTAIVVKDIDTATVAAQNAFLKNLEEPQENLYYILTCRSKKALLPTILSRCQTITVKGDATGDNAKVLEFIKMVPEEKLAVLDKVRTREEAVTFMEGFILSCHDLLHKTRDKHSLLAKYLKAGGLTLTRLKANGNVSLQLTNLVVNLS